MARPDLGCCGAVTSLTAPPPRSGSTPRPVAAQLAQAGATVVEVELPDSFAAAPDVQRIIMNVECAAFHEPYFRHRSDEYGSRLRANIEMGMLIPSVTYLQAQPPPSRVPSGLDHRGPAGGRSPDAGHPPRRRPGT